MIANQFRDILDRKQISQIEFARLISSNDRTVRRWALWETSIPETVAILLNLLDANKITYSDILAAKRKTKVTRKKIKTRRIDY